MFKRKVLEIGSTLYRNLIFPFVRISIELRTHSVMKQGAYMNKGAVLCGKNYVGKNTVLTNSCLGFGSYVSNNGNLSDIIVGKYCSIGPGFDCIGGSHPSGTFVSTHPAFYSRNDVTNLGYCNKNLFDENKYVDTYDNKSENPSSDNVNVNSDDIIKNRSAASEKKYCHKIGNDVWIGSNVSILQGVTIADGCIIGANSLVTKDLEPYGIYAGIPAKLIRKRFPAAQIAQLMEFKWWDRDETWIREHIESFTDINKFLN